MNYKANYQPGTLTITVGVKGRPDLDLTVEIPYATEAEARAFAMGRGCTHFNGKMIFPPCFPDPMLVLS
jgi:hypothetical protein